MSDTYAKVFSSITESTVWREPPGTRLIWIVILAKSDRFGNFYASVPGLAHLANVTLEECIKALETLQSPDPWSRTPDYEGRRIEPIDGGWRILNHAKYRAKRSVEERREYQRMWDAENRADRPSAKRRRRDSDGPETSPLNPTTPDNPRQVPTDPTPPASASAAVNVTSKIKSVTSTARGTRIPENWKPSADLIAFAMREWPGGDISREAERFVDHWRSTPGAKGIKTDWSATWRNWIRRAAESSSSPKHRESAVERVRRINSDDLAGGRVTIDGGTGHVLR